MSESVNSNDPTRIDLSLATPLQPGQYQVVLLGFNGVQGTDGSFVNTLGQDQTLASFTVASPGATLADARYLGVVRSSVRTVQGSLDLASHPSDVALYSFVVPSGSTWRLGAEVQAERIGSPIDTVLTLFDARGHVLAVDDMGRPDASLDPYLFQAVSPGLYYLGVSGSGNVPGKPGGYDVALGIAGSNAQTQPSGAFQLQVVADPISKPTTVTSFQINTDSITAQPIGFSIGFSGAIQIAPDGSLRAESANRDLVLVDQNGRSWPIQAVALSHSQSTLTYVFDQTMPAGHYRLKLAEQGGLADLAGQRLQAPGRPDGVLAEFDVAPVSSLPDPGQLGPVFPGGSGILSLPPVDLQAGEAWSTRFETVANGLTSFQVDVREGLVQVDLFGASGELAQSFITDKPRSTLPLKAGVWTVKIRAITGNPAHIQASLITTKPESLLENGVGQGPALSLRFVSTSNPTPQPGNPPPSSPTDPSPSPSSPPASYGESGSVAGPSLPQPSSISTPSPNPSQGSWHSDGLAAEPSTPGGLALTFGGQPVGRSESGADHVAAVGPEFVTGSIAYASNSAMPPTQRLEQPDSEGPLTGTDARVPLGPGRTPRPGGSHEARKPAKPAEPTTDGALLAGANLNPLETPPTLVEVPNLSMRLAATLSDILAAVRTSALETPASDTSDAEPEEGGVEMATFTSPMHLALGAVLAIQGRRTLSRWLGQRSQWRSAARASRSSPPSPHLGHRPILARAGSINPR